MNNSKSHSQYNGNQSKISNLSQDEGLSTIQRQTKNNVEDINISLLKKIENLENENGLLADALNELSNDNKEKELALEESHKIITKLNEEYSKLLKEYKSLQEFYVSVENDNLYTKKTLGDISKSEKKLYQENKEMKENLMKDSPAVISLKREINSIKKEFQSAKDKFEKEIKEKNVLLIDYSEKIESLSFTLTEREKVINDCHINISELTQNINKKEEEIKNLIKITKDVGTENKTNIGEMTKQAINTIKLFYNTLKANSDRKEGEQNKESFVSKEEVEKYIKEGKVSMVLEEVLVGQGSNDNTQLVDYNHLKSELLKSELYASLLREFNIIKFLDSFLPKNLKLEENQQKEKQTTPLIDNAILLIKKLNQKNKDLLNKITGLEKLNTSLINERERLEQTISKLKENTQEYINKIKNKFELGENTLNNFQEEIKKLTAENNELKQRIPMVIKEKIFKFERLISQRDNYFSINSVENPNNYSIYSNTSLNEKKKKNEENEKLKDEISRLKEEISNLIKSNSLNDIKLKERTRNSENFNNINNYSHINNNESLKKISEDELNILPKLNLNYNNEFLNENSDVQLNFKYDRDKEVNNINEFSKNSNQCVNCNGLKNLIRNFQLDGLSPSQLKEMKNYYISYEMDMQKAHSKVEDVINKFSNFEKNLLQDEDKKIKVSQVREIISGVHKLISLFSVFINKYYKDLHYQTSNLKKLFDFLKLILNSEGPDSSLSKNYFHSSISNNINSFSKTWLKMFYETNLFVFNQSELKKLYTIYENKNYNEILSFFKTNCEYINSNMIEKYQYDGDFNELEDAYGKMDSRRIFEKNINNSYKIVNERIIKLKKFEFEFVHFSEITKHFLVAQEILIKMLFRDSEVRSSSFSNKSKNAVVINTIDKLLKCAEDTLNTQAEDYLDYLKKLTFKLLRNQNCYIELILENN